MGSSADGNRHHPLPLHPVCALHLFLPHPSDMDGTPHFVCSLMWELAGCEMLAPLVGGVVAGGGCAASRPCRPHLPINPSIVTVRLRFLESLACADHAPPRPACQCSTAASQHIIAARTHGQSLAFHHYATCHRTIHRRCGLFGTSTTTKALKPGTRRAHGHRGQEKLGTLSRASRRHPPNLGAPVNCNPPADQPCPRSGWSSASSWISLSKVRGETPQGNPGGTAWRTPV